MAEVLNVRDRGTDGAERDRFISSKKPLADVQMEDVFGNLILNY